MVNVDSTDAFKNLWLIWRILGLNPPNDDSFLSRHYTIYSICTNIFINILGPSTFYIKCVLSSSLTELCESLSLTAIVINHQIKFIHAWPVLGRLKELHVALRHLDSRLQNRNECKIISDHITYSKRVFFLFAWLLIMISGTGAVYAAFKSGYELAFPCWYPWDWQSSNRVYWCTLICQTMSTYILSFMAANNDMYPISYLTMIAGHYRALAARISVLGYSNESESVTFGKLINCIEDHKTLLLAFDTLQYALSSVLISQFICTALPMCTITFYTIFVEISPMKVVTMLLIFLGVIFETYIVCYAAEEVDSGAEQMSQAIYECNWSEQPIKFQRTLILMLKRSQRPNVITSAGFMPVRMTTFQGVIKTAYSMFTLLNKFKN